MLGVYHSNINIAIKKQDIYSIFSENMPDQINKTEKEQKKKIAYGIKRTMIMREPSIHMYLIALCLNIF